MTWTPLLSGELADEAQRVVAEIRGALPHAFPTLDLETSEPSAAQVRMVSLEAGRGSSALLEHYCRGVGPLSTWGSTALAEAIVATRRMIEPDVAIRRAVYERPPLSVGPIGVAWLVAHLRGTDPADAAEAEIVRWADQQVRTLVSAMPWPSDYDLVVGLVGLGTYALERLPTVKAAEMLGMIVDRVDDLAEKYPDGLAWRTWPEMLVGHAERCPIGRYDLGIAHGVAGVIGLLGHIAAAGIARERVVPLLRGAVSWLLARKGTDGEPFQYPAWIQPDAPPSPARLGWCYGDLGVALALLSAARGLGEPGWEREALALARHVGRIDPTHSGVADATVCHGAIGVAHGFNRLAQSSGDDELAAVAREWFARGLSLQRPGMGLAGYSAVDIARDGTRRRVAYRGLVMGVAGIGLALQAAVSDESPAWDRLFLMSPPE